MPGPATAGTALGEGPRRRLATAALAGRVGDVGAGLLLVDAVAARWGVEPRGDGKAIRCEFTRSAPRAA
ncbi:hypothetical protein [Streptomyces niveus]|uniref:hypothetical protein n=1 Tax=Streptomyces niveus TaxID=193462 RepID=UPI003F5415F6